MDSSIESILRKYSNYRTIVDKDGIVYSMANVKQLNVLVAYSNNHFVISLNNDVVLQTTDIIKANECLNRLEQETTEWIFGHEHPMFQIAKSHVTKEDVNFIQRLTICIRKVSVPEDVARTMTANIRWKNRICNECQDKSDILKLFFCEKCYLVQYCSKECQEKNWTQHRERCCNPDGPLDDGPQQFT